MRKNSTTRRKTVSRAPQAPRYYFAYGSNLDTEQMLQRCPDAEPVGALTLPGMRLEFNGVATIIPCPNGHVEGAIYQISPADERALDLYEGYRPTDPDLGLYRKWGFRFTIGDAEHTAMVYVMNRGTRHAPSDYYLNTIRRGFADWHLPTETLDAAVARATAVGGPTARDLSRDVRSRVQRKDRSQRRKQQCDLIF